MCVHDSTQGCAVPRGPVTTVCVPAEPSPPLPSQLLFLPCSYVSRSWLAGDRGRVRSWDGESIPSRHTLASTCKHTNMHTRSHTEYTVHTKGSEYVTYANIQSKTESDALLAVRWWKYTERQPWANNGAMCALATVHVFVYIYMTLRCTGTSCRLSAFSSSLSNLSSLMEQCLQTWSLHGSGHVVKALWLWPSRCLFLAACVSNN